VTLRGTLDAAAYGPVRVSNLVTLAPDAGQPGLCLLGPGASLLARDAAVLDDGIILAPGRPIPARPPALTPLHAP